jgi:hypothetical protein
MGIFFAGNLDRKEVRASKPPAEAPAPTTYRFSNICSFISIVYLLEEFSF